MSSGDRPSMEQVESTFSEITPVARAPFTVEQVDSLNAFQASNVFHPFTHSRDEDGNEEVLVAQEDGWHCPNHPEYEQDWAWDWMADGSWTKMLMWREYPVRLR